MMTMWCVPVCGLNSLVDHFNVWTYDVWKGNVTIEREIETKYSHSLGFWDIRERMTLQSVTLWELGCVSKY